MEEIALSSKLYYLLRWATPLWVVLGALVWRKWRRR